MPTPLTRFLSAIAGCGLSIAGGMAAAQSVFVNEFHYDNTGSDTGEFIEVAGSAGFSLDGWTVELYNGNGGGLYDVVSLTGTLPDAGAGFGSLFFFRSGIQNGSPDGLALVDPEGRVWEFLSYEGQFEATGGSANGLLSTDVGVFEPFDTAIGLSLQRSGDAGDNPGCDWVGPVAESPGALNAGQVLGADGCPRRDDEPDPDPVIPGPGQVFVNEFHYDNDGGDVGEFVEIAGAADVDLSGWTVELYNGNGGARYDAILLAGVVPDEGDGFGALPFARSGIQNGSPDGLALVDPAGVVWEFWSYEGAFTAVDGSAAGLTSTDVAVSESSTTPAGFSLQRSGDNPGCDWTGPLEESPGSLNSGQVLSEAGCPPPAPEPVDACFDPATPIHYIQGSGFESPLEGTEQTIEAVVVGDFQGGDDSLEGFFLQEEDGDADGDPATSEGIFVFDGGFGVDVRPGDLVRVSGTVDEFFGLTELTAVTRVEVCGDGPAVTPAEPLLPLAAEGDLEAFEGMAVRLTQQLRIAEYFNFDRFGEIVLALPLTGDRPFQPTSVAEPGVDALAIQEANDLSRITLDDGLSSQNPAFLRHPNGEAFSVDNRFRGGDVITEVVGALSYSFGRYRVQPTAPAAYIAMNARPAAPDPVGGSLRVASFNVLNYFTTLDEGSPVCGPVGGLDCRGADSDEEFQRQRTKIIAALATIDADVVGLIEIENNAAAALEDLVSGLNAVSGDGAYAYVDTGTIGGDAIKVALIYRPATVTPVGSFAVLDGSVDPRFIDTRNRPVLAQTFSENASAARFTVAVNHLKSKGSDCDDLGDPDAGDGQGNCNLTRRNAALAQVDWLATDPTGSGDADFMIIGDINAYAKEDPVDAILAGADDTPGSADDFINLIEVFQGAEAYSFVFSGQFGYLDHAFANRALSTQVTGITEWHINADEPDALDYNTDFNPPGLYAPDAFRSSDHDPVIVGLALETTLGDILAFVDQAIADGELEGVGPGGRPEALLAAFREGLARSLGLEQSDRQRATCASVRRLLARVDGSGRPRDWVGGTAAAQVAALLEGYFSDAGCNAASYHAD